MKNIIYIFYSFIFSFYKGYYKKNESETHFHTNIILMCLVTFPVFGILIAIGLSFNENILFLSSFHMLTRKLILLPFGIILLWLTSKIIKRLNFSDKLDKIDFTNYSLIYKFKMFSLIFIIFWSILWMPLLIIEIIK